MEIKTKAMPITARVKAGSFKGETSKSPVKPEDGAITTAAGNRAITTKPGDYLFDNAPKSPCETC